MFEKFGELNSFGEINELAENLFNEGDTESLKAMAKENGIQSDFVDMYLQGEIPVLCDQLTAALGKIDVEVAELKPKEIMEDWVEYLRGQCMENELLAFNVRKKGKSLKGCIAALLMWSFKNQQTVDKGIIKAAGVSAGKVTLGIPGMTLQKLLNRIEKYSGCEYGTECSSASARIRHTATTYADYLSMRINLGYDLNNTVYQQPQDLEAEHNKMVMETNKEEMDKHLKEVAERYPEIRHVYRGLRNKYLYEDDKYIIRPARSAEEIVMEGRLLHHCVGGDTYLNKHNTGKTYILMLRFKAEPDIPYITVEIDAKNPRILQWYGDKDKKPDEKNMQSWLNTWLMKLKTGTLTETIQTAAIA